MTVRYKPGVHYNCRARHDSHALAACQYVEGTRLEAAVVEVFFAAIQPAELDLLDAALATLRAEWAQRGRQHAEQVQRAEYEARLAEARS